jgi:hypothetical protein
LRRPKDLSTVRRASLFILTGFAYHTPCYSLYILLFEILLVGQVVFASNAVDPPLGKVRDARRWRLHYMIKKGLWGRPLETRKKYE